jgi:hypothetical protein
MVDSDDLRFIVTSKAHAYRGTLFAKRSSVELGWNRTSTAEFVIDDDHPLLPDLVTDGCRVRVLLNGVQEMSGLVEHVGGTFPQGEVTVLVNSDFQMLYYALAWPKPTSAIGSQTDEYRIYTGVSETVAKLAISEANTRLSLGWTIPATTGLGTTTRVETRFHPLPDRILEPLLVDRLQLRVDRSEAGAVTVDVTEGTEHPTPVTLESGLLVAGDWSRSAPTVTRVIVGGSGEGVARELAQFTAGGAALETAWGIKREVFRDARSSDTGADLSTDATKAFAEGATKSSLSASLSETSWFQYHNGYELGDSLTVNIGVLSVSEVISTVLIEDDDKQGLRITPSIGEVSDSAEKKFVSMVAGLARGIRDQGRK